MDIQIDSREKAHVLTKIYEAFDRRGVNYFTSKCWVGDYVSLDNPRVAVDRKQNLQELCGNVCQEHERFRAEMIRAQEHGIKLIFLCEHGCGIRNLADVALWKNPRALERRMVDGHWRTVHKKVMHGETLCKILMTMERKYGVQFLFCDKDETGDRIIDLLSERRNI